MEVCTLTDDENQNNPHTVSVCVMTLLVLRSVCLIFFSGPFGEFIVGRAVILAFVIVCFTVLPRVQWKIFIFV
jgi:hypothetical protein